MNFDGSRLVATAPHFILLLLPSWITARLGNTPRIDHTTVSPQSVLL